MYSCIAKAILAELLEDLSQVQDELLDVLTQKRQCMATGDVRGMTALQPQMNAQELQAIVLQTDESSEGLLRDWPQIASGVEKNLAYAFQWFCLAALQLLLYIWFQFIQPYRHARRTSF